MIFLVFVQTLFKGQSDIAYILQKQWNEVIKKKMNKISQCLMFSSTGA